MGVQLFAVTGSHGTAITPPGTEMVAFRELAAVVGEAAPDGDVALAHYRKVVECVFRRQGVLPAPPGTVFRDRGLVMQWLELHYFTLLDTLGFVDDRVVARVTVVRSPAHEPGEEVDEAAETVLQDALRVLRRHAVATVSMGGGDTQRPVAASFLVDRERWEHFADMVESESARLPDFTLSLSGPWPPYDFVRMRFDS
ncbi:MAG TPA: GvpL/GvpF family gas vesicle protein [Gemmatimonadaceae bacterium]|nr:GvpL/GvpF family gas vesicle protein [Gemmatimonadaceae bacterium]